MGSPSTIEKHPYLAVYADEEGGCTGAIISPYHILAFAPCVCEDIQKHLSVTVYTGSVGPLFDSTISNVSKIICHDNFNEEEHEDNVAILVLSKKLKFDNTTAAIPLATKNPRIGEWGFTSGMGFIDEEGTDPNMFYTAPIRITNCTEFVANGTFCAGGDYGPKACPNDSGASLVINGTLVGIWGSGYKCRGSGLPEPAHYVSVPDYKDWIEEKMKETTPSQEEEEDVDDSSDDDVSETTTVEPLTIQECKSQLENAEILFTGLMQEVCC